MSLAGGRIGLEVLCVLFECQCLLSLTRFLPGLLKHDVLMGLESVNYFCQS